MIPGFGAITGGAGGVSPDLSSGANGNKSGSAYGPTINYGSNVAGIDTTKLAFLAGGVIALWLILK